MTIDLGPDAVSRVTEPTAPVDDSGAPIEPAASEPAAGEPADLPSESGPAEAGASDSLLGTPDNQTVEAQAHVADAAPAKSAVEEPARPAFGRDSDFSRKPAESRPAEPSRPASQPAARRGASVSGLFAGIIGGVVALLVAWGLQQAGVIPGGESATPPIDNSEAISALQAQVAALRQDVAGLKEAPEPAGIGELKQAVEGSAAKVGELTTALDTVKADLAALRKAVESGGAGDGAAVQALEARIREIEASIAALGQGGGQGDPAALEALGTRIATIESAISAAASATAATDGRIAALEQSIAALAQKVESLGGQPKIALAIAAAALRSALDRGGTFTAEVETFAAVAPDSPDIAALREIAATGVATRTEIAGEMADAANAIIAAGDVADEDAGFFEGLWDGISSLVTVRPIGQVEGPGVPETVARMEVAVQQGDFTKALAEYDTLPEAAKAAGAAFADKIRTRLAAEQLIEKALAAALKAA